MVNQSSSRLRFIDAHDLDTEDVTLHGMDVYGWEHEKLGDLDGFIGDVESGRLYYAVVDSGGWFSSRQFLLPIGHLIEFNHDKNELQADVAKEALQDLPEYDRDRFTKLSDDELRTFQRRTDTACCPEHRAAAVSEVWIYDTAPHYREPVWATTRRTVAAGRGRPAAGSQEQLRDARQAPRAAVAPAARPIDDRREEERRREEARREAVPHREYVSARDRDDEPVADAGDVSPHLGGRAQPGDVLGVETGGERSHLGEDAGDENKRRREAEREVSKRRKDE